MITTTYDPEQWQLVPKVMTGGMLFRFGETTKPYGERWRNTLAIAPQHESQWQPIETAPKDCNIILFGRWWSDEQGWMKEPVIGRWNQKTDGRWEFANAGGWWGIRPTVWMPLPQHPNTIKVPRPEGHDSLSIEIKTSYGGGSGGGSCPDTGETLREMMDKANALGELPYRKMEHVRDNGDGTLTINRPIPYERAANPMIQAALNKSEDATGLCTVREAVAMMRESKHDPMEMVIPGENGERINVELKIIRVCEHPRTSIVWDEAYRRCDDCNASVPAEG